MANRSLDGCVFVRNAYNGFLDVCATNKFVTAFLFGSPVYWTIGTIIYYSPTWNKDPSQYKNQISSPVYTVLAIISATWLLAIFAVLRFWPNLLSISVFVYETFGHWCLVTLAILGYISGTVPIALTQQYFAFIGMPVLLLLLSAEILRTHRSKMFSHNVSQDRMMENAAASPNEQVPAEL
jgi:hypothetical protein